MRRTVTCCIGPGARSQARSRCSPPQRRGCASLLPRPRPLTSVTIMVAPPAERKNVATPLTTAMTMGEQREGPNSEVTPPTSAMSMAIALAVRSSVAARPTTVMKTDKHGQIGAALTARAAPRALPEGCEWVPVLPGLDMADSDTRISAHTANGIRGDIRRPCSDARFSKPQPWQSAPAA